MDSKLKTLLDIYRLNNIDLARGTGIDPSLVSRFRSGVRRPTADQIRLMAVFFAGEPLLAHDKDVLTALIGDSCESLESAAAALARWIERSDSSVAPVVSRGGWENLAGCVPELLTDQTDIYRRRLALLAAQGCCSLYKPSLSAFFIPPELILARYPVTGADQMEKILQTRRCFEQHAAEDGWIEVLPITLYDAIILNASCVVTGSELFTTESMTLVDDALTAALMVIQGCLEKYPHFSLVFTETPAPCNLWLRENAEALYVWPSSGGSPGRALHLSAPGHPALFPADRGKSAVDELLQTF